MEYARNAVLIGLGATLATDLWTLARKRLFGTPLANYGLVGRWIGHMPQGRFRHERITDARLVPGELAIGWTAHYLIGITFASLFLAMVGLAWASEPTPGPALLFGLATVAAPFLLMQPGMGAGFAASRTPKPNAARLQSLVTHAVFGVGLYASALFLTLFSGE